MSQTIYAYFDVDGGLQISYADSSKVGSTIPPGTYTINLNNNGADDLGVDHIFHLSGPGVDYKAANVDTTAVFSVTFQPGGTYRCSTTSTRRSARRSSPPTLRPPTTTTPLPSTPVTGSTKPTAGGVVGSQVAPPLRGSLDAIVSSGGKLSLTRGGKTVRLLKPGRYTFSVVDGSKSAGFTVRSLRGKPVAISSNGFVGRRHLIVSLTPGSWFFFTAGGRTKSFSVATK